MRMVQEMVTKALLKSRYVTVSAFPLPTCLHSLQKKKKKSQLDQERFAQIDFLFAVLCDRNSVNLFPGVKDIPPTRQFFTEYVSVKWPNNQINEFFQYVWACPI